MIFHRRLNTIDQVTLLKRRAPCCVEANNIRINDGLLIRTKESMYLREERKVKKIKITKLGSD